MDIISMQIANKILKRINTDYNGFLQMSVAIQDQKAVTVTKEYSVGANTLSVYVDGVLAYLTEDYVETDANTITFVKGLEAGAIVLFKTNVAGVPKYVTANPAYDDTAVRALITTNANGITTVDGKFTPVNLDITNIKGDIVTAKSDIVTAQTKIDSIIALLDDDTDGEIIDIFANLKTQWETADGDLQTLLADKVGSVAFEALNSEMVEARETFGTLKERIADLVGKITANETGVTDVNGLVTTMGESITDIVGDITTISEGLAVAVEGISAMAGRLTTVESDITTIQEELALPKPNYLTLTDTVTGFVYEIRMTNGVLKSDLLKVLTAALIARAGSGEIYTGSVINFTVSSTYQDASNATSESTFAYSVSDETRATINAATGELTAIDLGIVTITVNATVGTTTVNGTTTITIVVNKVEKVSLGKAALDLGNISAVIADIVLPVTSLECNLSWASNDLVTISNAGIVTRPSGTVGNKNVALTSTISYSDVNDTKVFNATVVALPFTDVEKVGIAKTSLTLGDTSGVIANVILPATQDEAGITWISDNEAVVSNTGVVIRPTFGSGNITVTLTATITVGVDTDTKAFTLTVLQATE